MIKDLRNNATAFGLTFTALGVLAVLLNEGRVGLRMPFELSGLLGGHRVKAVLSHLFLLFGLACLALAVPLWVLHLIGIG